MPESKHHDIYALRGLYVTLGMLLECPDPGLITWRQALHETLLEMACYAGVGYAPRHAAELLAACKSAWSRLQLNNRFPEIQDQLYAAIAKAEGRS